jgi:hypothetical protein
MLHAYLYTICFVFCYTLWRFYAFSGTNLLTRCHSASSLFLLFLCFRKATQEIFSELDETKARIPIFPEASRSPKLRQRRTRGQAHHRVARPTPGPHHQVVWPPGPPSDTALPPIYSPRRENLKGPINFLRNILQATAVADVRSRGSRSSSQHPVREGNHCRRPSSSPSCLRSDVWVVYLGLGSIAVARWLSSPPCTSCLDLVSCLSWSRSSLCNSTCRVCWDPMNIDTMLSWCDELLSLCYLYVVYDLACSPLLIDILAE